MWGRQARGAPAARRRQHGHWRVAAAARPPAAVTSRPALSECGKQLGVAVLGSPALAAEAARPATSSGGTAGGGPYFWSQPPHQTDSRLQTLSRDLSAVLCLATGHLQLGPLSALDCARDRGRPAQRMRLRLLGGLLAALALAASLLSQQQLAAMQALVARSSSSMWQSYCHHLNKRPLLTKAATGACSRAGWLTPGGLHPFARVAEPSGGPQLHAAAPIGRPAVPCESWRSSRRSRSARTPQSRHQQQRRRQQQLRVMAAQPHMLRDPPAAHAQALSARSSATASRNTPHRAAGSVAAAGPSATTPAARRGCACTPPPSVRQSGTTGSPSWTG